MITGTVYLGCIFSRERGFGNIFKRTWEKNNNTRMNESKLLFPDLFYFNNILNFFFGGGGEFPQICYQTGEEPIPLKKIFTLIYFSGEGGGEISN